MAKVSPGGNRSHFAHSHTVHSLQGQVGVTGKKVLSKPAYSASPTANAPAPSGISPLGAKALGARAKAVLKPLADPNEAP